MSVAEASSRSLTTSISSLAFPLSLGVFLAGAGTIAFRRLSLGHIAPLPLVVTLVVAATLLVGLWLLRRLAAGAIPPWLSTVVLSAWGIACSAPGTQLLAWLIWGGVLLVDLAMTDRLPSALLAIKTGRHIAAIPTVVPPLEQDTLQTVLDAEHQDGEWTDEANPTLLQQITRLRDAEGQESIHATLRGEVEAGDHTATLYIGFCPPFKRLPHVEAELVDGPAGMAKTVQTLHNGAEVEVKLDLPAAATTFVVVELAALESC